MKSNGNEDNNHPENGKGVCLIQVNPYGGVRCQ